MKVSGTSTLAADRAAVWAALNDPAVLVAAIPGCRRLEAIGADAFAMTVAAGVGSIKGVYDGQVRLTDQQEPGSFRMHAQGSGAAGTIGAEVAVRLEDAPGGGTSLTYDADAVVGGMIGGVGQRMLTGVSKRMAEEFFRNVERVVSSGVGAPSGAPVAAGAAGDHTGVPLAGAPGAATAAPSPAGAGAAPGTVFTAAASNGGPGSGVPGTDFLKGVVVGGALALAGVLVGGWVAGRHRYR